MDKSELLNYRALVLEAAQLRDLLFHLSVERYSFPAPASHEDARPSRSKAASFEGRVIRYSEAVEIYERKLADIDARTVAVECAVGALTDPVERLVMRLRYIEGQRWVNVCVELQALGYSERQVYRLHGAALEKLKEI